MFKDKHYFAVGLFVLLVCAMGGYFVYWLAVAKEPADTRRYLVYFEDSVRGLTKGSQVRYKGLNVGRVQDVRIAPDNPHRVEVMLEIEQTTPILSNTRASIQMQGVTGLSYVALNHSGAPGTAVQYPNQGVPEIGSTESSFDRLMESAPRLMNQVTELTRNINRLFNDQNISRISNILKQVEQTSAQLEPSLVELTSVLQQTSEALQHITEAAENLQRTSEQAQPQIMGTLNNIEQTSRHLAQASHQLQKLISDNQGSISEFVQSGLPEFNQLIRESRATVQEIQSLAESLQRNPSQLIVPSNIERTEIAP